MNGGEQFELSESSQRVACEIEERQKVLDLRPPIKLRCVREPGIRLGFA
jgi:hypothetical protein